LEKSVMKKTLVALAAVAATSAFAQSSVTIYGLLDVGYGTTKTETAGVTTRKTSGLVESTTAGNRLGFRGVEDLGGGTKAGFVVEQGLTLTNGGNNGIFGVRAGANGHMDSTLALGAANTGGGAFTAATARQTFVSLSSASMGEVRVGYQINNVYSLASFSGYLYGYEGAAGAETHLYGNADVGGTRGNSITYLSPKFSGFDVVVQYGGGGTGPFSTTTSLGEAGIKRTGLMLNYANGPFKSSLAYTRATNNAAGTASKGSVGSVLLGGTYNDCDDIAFGGCVNRTTVTIVLTPSSGTVAATPATSSTAHLTQLGASYDFGVASVNGTYNRGADGKAVETNRKAYQLGVKVPFGAASFYASWGKAKSDIGGVDSADIKQYQLAAEYAFSKRTMAYVMTGQTKDTIANNKGTSTRLGLRHTF
jgi:predicted porin